LKAFAVSWVEYFVWDLTCETGSIMGVLWDRMGIIIQIPLCCNFTVLICFCCCWCCDGLNWRAWLFLMRLSHQANFHWSSLIIGKIWNFATDDVTTGAGPSLVTSLMDG
jgi:ABC-type multidrug transport system permease subunit